MPNNDEIALLCALKKLKGKWKAAGQSTCNC